MDLKRLEYFLAIIDEGTVTAAADELRVAQPALSRQMKTLERETGLKLFEPSGNRLAVTPSGAALVPLARRLVAEARDTDRAIRALRSGRIDRLVCGATESSIRGFIAPFVATLTDEDPLILTRSGGHESLPALLLTGVDFLVAPFAPDPALASQRIGTVRMRASISPAHPWAVAGRTEVSPGELVDEPLIVPGRHVTSRQLLDHALFSAHPAARPLIECDDHLTIMALASAGRGVGVSAEPAGYGAQQIEIVDPATGAFALSFPLYAAWLPGHHAETTLRTLSTRLADHLLRTTTFASA